MSQRLVPIREVYETLYETYETFLMLFCKRAFMKLLSSAMTDESKPLPINLDTLVHSLVMKLKRR